MIPILYILSNTQIAGSEKELLMVLKYSDRTQFQSYVLVHDQGPMYQLLKEKKELVFVLPKWGRLDPFYYFRLLLFLKKHKIQLMILSNRIPGLFGKLLKVRSIQRRNQPVQKIGKFGRLPGINALLYLGIDKILCVSKFICDNIADNEKVSREKMAVIYNGIELDQLPKEDINSFRKEHHLDENQKIIGLIGRLHPQKGIEFFLAAIPAILAEEPSCRFIICGGGELEGKLKQQAKDLGIWEEVRFLGFRQDALKILSCFDISVMSSLWEGFPFVALETFSQQKPIVATRVGGIPELVEESNGVLVAAKDSKALGKAILYLLKHPEIAKKLARNGYQRVTQTYRAELMAQNTERLYLDVLKR